MIFKILLSRSVQTPNSDTNWQTSCPLQTLVCNIYNRVTGSTGSPGGWIPGSLGRWVTKCDQVPCLLCIGKEVKYVQKKAPLRPNWQASFDAHLYAGRMMELVVMQRPEEKKVSEIRVSVQSLADHCKTTDDIASIWVRTSSSKLILISRAV